MPGPAACTRETEHSAGLSSCPTLETKLQSSYLFKVLIQ